MPKLIGLFFLFGEEKKKKSTVPKNYLGYLLTTSLLRFQQSGAVAKSNSSACVLRPQRVSTPFFLSLWLPAGQEHRTRTPLTPLHTECFVVSFSTSTFGKKSSTSC